MIDYKEMIRRLEAVSNGYWVIPEGIDTSEFDFDWRPNAMDRPYIHQFGTQWQSTGGPKFVVPGAEGVKYQNCQRAKKLADKSKFKVLVETNIDFDYSWHPDENEPDFIWTFGNQYLSGEEMPTVEYVVGNATQRKFVHDIKAKLISNPADWVIYKNINLEQFDLSWYPHPYEPPYIYVWGNQYLSGEEMPTVEYRMPGATQYKYMSDRRAKLISKENNWVIHDRNIFPLQFDAEWTPHPHEPPYIYVWGNKWIPAELKPTVEYRTPGATEYKYMGNDVQLLPEEDRWVFLTKVDPSSFDFTWRPDPREPAYIYVWGNQYLSSEEMPTVEYHTPGATERKYMGDIVFKLANNPDNWVKHTSIKENSFDWSWAPHPHDPPYIYVWGNKWIPGEVFSTVEYVVPGATERKYMPELVELEPEWNKWRTFENVKNFDYTWRPSPVEPPYIYVWGNKWIPGELQPTIEYTVPGATAYKYMEDQVNLEIDWSKWTELLPVDKAKFDFTWRPDPREPAYIYVWGNQHWGAEVEPTIEYHTPGATERKYMSSEYPKVLPDYSNWITHIAVDETKFDWSWHPDPGSPPYIYVWGNRWIPGELEPTIEYVVPGATERKYMPELVEVLPEKDRWTVHQEVDKDKFDFTWRPDPREPAYIYVWGNRWIPGELEPTVEYAVPGATERKYMPQIVEVIPEEDKWVKLLPIDNTTFDFTWRPDPREPAYIYVWGNQHNSAVNEPTVKYVCTGATEYKYMEEIINVLPEYQNWNIIQEIDQSKFDWTWRPDPGSPPYIYVWGNKWIPGELESTLEYRVPGATERKYMHELVEVIPDDNWVEIRSIDKRKFDFTWRPDPREPAYIYVWGNKWIPGELESTLEYRVPGATERKYMQELVEVLPEEDRWKKLLPIDNTTFDFTWRPDPREPAYIYVWGNQHNSAVKEPTVEYWTPGATERKYMDGGITVLPNYENWKIYQEIDNEKFDWSWRPDPGSPPYIYVWGNKWIPGELEPTIEYIIPGATERKYMPGDVPVIKEKNRWESLLPVDDTTFDFTWRPDPREPAYIYVWGNQHNNAIKEPTVLYKTPGAWERKYITDVVATVLPTKENWRILIKGSQFDWSWRPDPDSPPYIYVWGNQWNPVDVEPTVEYHTPGATQYKYMSDRVATAPETRKNWKILIDGAKFDRSWRPDPREPAYIYVWGNKWNSAPVEPTIEYHVPGAKDRKYMDDRVAELPPTKKLWSVSNKSDLETFDFSWRPDPGSPPQIYQWADGGPTYTVPGATEVVYMERGANNNIKPAARYYIKTTLEDLITEHKDEVFWALNPDLNYGSFDFAWRPNADNFRHINVFGNELSKDTQTYYINAPLWHLGYRQLNYVEDQSIKVDTNLSMFWVDTGLGGSERYDALKARYPDIQKTRYLNSWVDTVNRCIKKSKTKLAWILSSDIDYSGFSFDFYPASWQQGMLHVFGTQWGNWSNTYLVNCTTFPEDSKYIKIIEHLKNINHVRGKKVKTATCRHDILWINHSNKSNGLDQLRQTGRKVWETVYASSYLETIRGWINANKVLVDKKDYYLWITSSICDYSSFDFTWQADPFQLEQLHVFASTGSKSRQKFGDTFLLNVQEFIKYCDSLDDLQDYSGKINFIGHIGASRLGHPIVHHNHDSQVTAIKELTVPEFPYVELIDVANSLDTTPVEPPSLWVERKTELTVATHGASRIIVPAIAIDKIEDEVYDWTWIAKPKQQGRSKPIDIIFISNGEPVAEENYVHLEELLKKTHTPNKLRWVKGVDGRVASQHAAANVADTNWYFLVNGKLKVDKEFDWGWQPDRLQQPKHYIFNATNPVNGLVYGHQAIVANNKNLTLTTKISGLDFTLASLHGVVYMNSGVAIYNTDPWTTWRTAFRESIKLRANGDAVSKYRLDRWTAAGNGNYSEISQRGALDGVEYYEGVGGNMDKLLLTYDWAWIKEYYHSKYK